MASFAKSSRGRRPPFPKNKKMAAKNDDTFSKYIKESPRNEIEDSSTVGEMDSDDEAPTRDTASPTKTGVAYLTENLIKRLTKEENVAQVTTLHVTLGKELNKKIKYIENLENVRKLLHLSLNNHMIEKIEKLDHLTQLRELHLANNRISKIEGLDLLVHLTVLNLNGNLIKNLPAPLFKKLKELQTFHISHNQLRSLIEVTKLRPLQDLSSFSLEGNPMASMEHSWQFVIFQLRSLKLLDGKEITEDDRQMADERFAQEEVRRLEEELFRQKKDFHTLQEEKQQALEELRQLKKLLSEQQVLSLDQSQKVKELHQQLEAKEELLASKTAELSKACEKQFKLEQELAFYKLDAKFEHLGMLPPPDLEFEDGEDDESPYIGKARFKPNKFTRKSNIADGEQHAEVTTMGSRPSDRYHEQNRQVQQELHDSLIFDLHNKERAIEQAEEVLAQLNDQLNKRKAQVQDAGDKLAQIQQAIVDQAQLLGEEERKLIDAIAEKKNYIRKLQQVSKELEDRMRNTADDMRQREAETEKLRQTVRNTPQTDPAYSHLQTRLAAKEQQLLQLQDEYGKLKQDHDRARARLEEEIAAVKDLEAQLATLRKANSDQDKLKEELKNIIDDLNDNLNSMKQQVAQQAKQISQLQHEKDALGQKLKAMQTQSANNKQLKDNIAKLQQQLKLNEDALERERKNCEALRRRLSDFEAKAAQGTSVEPALADAKKRLHDAEAEVARLQNALNKLKQQLQDDRRAADERLKKEQDKVSRALQAARSAGDKDREMKELAAQISALTKDNASLAERQKDAEDELKGLENLLDKEDVLERLAELKGDINRRRSAVREPYSDQDDLGRAIRELHQKYIDLMGELEKERRKQPNGEVEGLQARLQDAERALRQAKDRASQLAGDKNQQDAKLRQMADELKRLRDKLGRQEDLEDELENAKAEHAEEMSGLERQIAQLKDQLLKAKHGVQDQLANARAPLQAKIRDMEDEMQYLQDKLEKVKADNEKLKGAIKSVEAGREDLQDRLADMKEKLREARAQADEANARHDRQRHMLEDKVKALENELERARNRLQSLRAQAEERLQAEKEKAAAKIDGLEEEIDGLKSRLRRLQDKADQELDRMRDAGARQVRDLEGKMADLRNQLDNERVRADEQLRKARNKEAGLKNLLGETQAQLERTSHQSHAQQAKLQELENEIDGLKRALKEAETQALKDKLNKELEAAHAERMKMAIEAAADKQLAEAQQQISSLQSLLADKDRQLLEQLTQGTQNASDIAAQRAEIRNLASALAEQNDELERLNDDLTQMSRGPVHTQYLHNPDPSLTALAGEVEALRAALSQKEQQVANLTSPIHVPVHPPFASTLVTTPGLMPTQPPVPQMTISGLATTPGVVPSQAYVPQFTTSVLPTTPVLVPSHTYVPVVATSSMATTPAAIFTQTYVPSAVPGPAQEVVSGTSATQTVPAVSALVTSPGGPSSPEQVHHHHHHHYVSRKSPRGVRKPKAVTLTTSTHLSPELLSASTVTPPVSSVRHHHHHYDDVSSQDGDAARRKKRKSKKRQQDVLFCNFPNHEGLEYEVGRLEGLLSSSLQAQKFQDSRDSLRMDLKDLENEVETSLKRRAASKLSRNKRHSLDGNLANVVQRCLYSDRQRYSSSQRSLKMLWTHEAQQVLTTVMTNIVVDKAGSERVFIMKAIDEEVEEEGENFPIKYLQQSSGPGIESTNQMKNFTQEVHWDKRLSDLARVESIIEERKAELKEVDAVLTERRRQLEEIFQRCNLAEGRLRRAEEDAGVIEQRAAETSVELIRAGNQLISLEIKEKSLNDRQDHINKTLQGKSRELKEVENACEVVRRNVDKLNQELKSKMEDLENKKSHLTEVESRIQLSLRVEELRNLVAHTEKEVKTQEQKYLQALKEGEKALEDKTCQLARTRNQIQIQMTEFHGLNSKVNRLRAEMKELQLNLRKEQEEAKRLSLRRQEEERNHELKVKEAKEKLEEVNKARNESMDALKNHREEFALLRGKIRESMTKMKEYEELKQQKEVECEEMLSSMNDEKIELENELSRLKSETQSAEDSRTQIMGELTGVATELETAMDELQGSKTTRDSVLGEINGLEKDLSDKKEELNRLKVETENASKELEREKEKITGIQARHDEMIAEMKKEDDKVEKSDKDSLPQESSTPRQKANGVEHIVDKLQETVKHLTADNEEKQNALIDARAEVKELKELIESERNKAHDYFLQMASETEIFKKHIERLRKENSAERQRFSMEKESVLHKVEEHRLKARKLSEELNTLKRNHLLTKQQLDHMKDTLARDVKELKEHIEGLSSQMRVEFARSLRHVANSKEQTSEEIEQLREKEDEIEIQLIAIQQSIRAAKQMAIVAAKEKLDESKREKEETLLKEQGVKLVQQQTLLRDQIRQQMSSRAESLDEERKKAEVSLEGLKKKLKSLEEVITRKDSSVEDFRLKSKVTAEKEADSSKQIEELKRRLREMEEEKELIQCQRNHLVELKDAVSVDGIGSDYSNLSRTNGDKLKETHSTQMCRSLDSQMDNSFHTRLVKCDFELPCRDREEMLNTSVPWSIRGADVSRHTENKTEPAEVPRPPSSDRSSVRWNPTGQVSFEMTAANNSGKKRSFDTFDATENWTAHSFPGKLISQRIKLSSDTGDNIVVSESTNAEEIQEDKTLTVSDLMSNTNEQSREENKEHWQVEKGHAQGAFGSASSFAGVRKSECIASKTKRSRNSSSV